jgi:uncharacterized protein (DUF885 family)
VCDDVLSAYQRQIQAGRFVHAPHDAGIRIAQGAEIYAVALRAHTTMTMSADEIHEMGVTVNR